MAVDTSGTTIIAKGTKITGTVEIECKFHIDGQVDGTIKSSNVVTIGSSGSVKGEIFAQKLVVSGELDGNADCENVEILAGGKMSGDLLSSNLIIESQAVFEGYSKIRTGNEPVKEKSAFSIFTKPEPREIREIKESKD